MSDFESRWRNLISGKTPGWRAALARGGLAGLAGLYGGGMSLYRLAYDLGLLKPRRLACPVISVGNITIGGTGKTTTVRWLARRLQKWGVRVAVLSYGYRAESSRRRGRGPVVVAGTGVAPVPVEVSGDEPLLLAQSLPGVPILAGRDRIRSGQAAREQFPVDAFILDDGFQYWPLAREVEIVLLDALNPFGWGRLLPRGLLREPLRALGRAMVVILTHSDWLEVQARQELTQKLLAMHAGLMVAEARHSPVALRVHGTATTRPLDSLREGRWLALSSLGHPESFERTLQELAGCPPVPLRFGDHHRYTWADLRRVCARVETECLAGVVTTEKDSVKIRPEWLEQTPCRILEVDLQFVKGQDGVESLLYQRIVAPLHHSAGG